MIAELTNHLWQSTLFAVAAGLLTIVFRKNRAEIRYWLWFSASFKFFVPFSLLMSLGQHIGWAPAARTGDVPSISFTMERFTQPFPHALPSAPSMTGTIVDWIPLITFGVWVCGFGLITLIRTRGWNRIQAAVRSSTPIGIPASVEVRSSPGLLEPGVVGLFHPILLLPAGIVERLTPRQLGAVLAHELSHVRRRDNVTSAIHMIVEAIFWFHPLVWWLGARLVEERERACDEEVVRLGNQPRVYAESILKTCQFYVESPLVCVSGVTSADLKKRVVHIMTQSIPLRLNLRKKLLLATAGITAVTLPLGLGILNASPGRAQSQAADNTPPVSFEVASIKPDKSGTPNVMIRVQPGGRFAANNITVEALLEESYQVTKSQIAGAPSWIDSDRFDITAKPSDSAAAVLDKLPPDEHLIKTKEMVRALLADRFKLVLGHETRELPVYFLVVAKNGPKFHPSTFQPPSKLSEAPTPGKRNGGIWFTGRGKLTLTYVEMPRFANVLSRGVVHRIVIDKTGLTGKYDFNLQWTPDGNEGPIPPGGPPGGPNGASAPPEQSGPSIFTALQEQLGLKLESAKAPVEILAIQHVEKPSEN